MGLLVPEAGAFTSCIVFSKDVIRQVEKSFLQNEGRCRDGVNYEKGCQQEDASADNKNHTSIPTSFICSV